MSQKTSNLLMTDYIRTYPKVLDPQACQIIIDRFEQHPELHTVHPHFESIPYSFAEVNVTQHWQDIHDTVFGAIRSQYDAYRKDLGITIEWPSTYAYEQLRMKRYLPNGVDQFGEHVDVGDLASARRFLVSFLYLNTLEAGGGTLFSKLGHRVQPQAGTLIMFPPMWPWLHAGLKPEGSSKYIIGTYLHYK